MRRFILNFIIFFSAIITFFFLAETSYAACTISADPSSLPANFNGTITITATGCNLLSSTQYLVLIYPKDMESNGDAYQFYPWQAESPNGQTLTPNISLTASVSASYPWAWTLKVCQYQTSDLLSNCADSQYIVAQTDIEITAIPPPPSNIPQITNIQPADGSPNTCIFLFGDPFTATVTNIQPKTHYYWWFEGGTLQNAGTSDNAGSDLTLKIPANYNDGPHGANPAGQWYTFCVDKSLGFLGTTRKIIGENCIPISLRSPSSSITGDTSCSSLQKTAEQAGTLNNEIEFDQFLPPCAQWVDSGGNPISTPVALTSLENGEFIKCASVMTAVGTISTDPASFITSVFTIVLGLAGGIALILIILAGYRYMTSQGNPEAVKAANEQLTAAIVGLLFIIFSFVILRTIGVDILKIPSFPIFSSGSGSSTTPGGTSGGSSSSSSTVCKGSCRHDCDDSADQTNTSDCRPPNRYCCVGE
jgi:hypothetical protein